MENIKMRTEVIWIYPNVMEGKYQTYMHAKHVVHTIQMHGLIECGNFYLNQSTEAHINSCEIQFWFWCRIYSGQMRNEQGICYLDSANIFALMAISNYHF